MALPRLGKPLMRGLLAASLLASPSFLALTAPSSAQETQAESTDPDAIVATVDGIEITQRDLAIAASDLADIIQRLPPTQVEDYIISFLVDMKLIARKAEEDGLANDETFKRQMAFERDKALVQAKLRTVGEDAVTDEALRARYEEAIKDFASEPEVRARHILVKTEEEAKEIKSQIDDGASFEDMAKEHSTDGASQNGGDLGYFKREMMVKPFGDAAFAMEAGDISDPVETQFGWHLIKVEDKRDSAPPPFEDVQDEVRREVAQQARRDYVVQLREGASIDIAGDEEAAAEETDEEKPAE